MCNKMNKKSQFLSQLDVLGRYDAFLADILKLTKDTTLTEGIEYKTVKNEVLYNKDFLDELFKSKLEFKLSQVEKIGERLGLSYQCAFSKNNLKDFISDLTKCNDESFTYSEFITQVIGVVTDIRIPLSFKESKEIGDDISIISHLNQALFPENKEALVIGLKKSLEL